LFSSFIVVIGSIVGCFSQTYNTLVAARVIQGLGIAAYESLTFSVVSDLFYVHQRGFWINVISFTLICGSSFSSVISGPVALNLGWHYLFYLIVACSGFQTVLLFLFCPESSYIRDPIFNQDLVLGKANGAGDEMNEKASGTVSEYMQSAYPPPPPAKTFWQKLAPYNGVFSDESLFKLILGPFLCVTNLAALWLVVITGTITSFYVGISYITAQLFTVAPYLLSTAGVGYLSLGPSIGSLLGSVVVAMATDPLAIWMAKRNRGIYEPEFRLPICAFGLIAVAGFVSFGAVSQAQGNIYLIDFLWGLALFGICFVVGPCSSYVVDAYRDMGSEIFVASVMFKNFLFFGYSYFLNNWVASAGPAIPYYIFSGVAAGLILSVIPAYMFGKRYRSFWFRYNVMAMLNFKTHSEF
jgi:MFS family permease